MPTIALTIAGSAVAVPSVAVLGPFTAYSRGGHASLALYRRGEALVSLPDSWAAKAVTLTINGTLYFSGQIVSGPEADYQDSIGWVQSYQALGLRALGDRVPFTDDNTGLDSAPFNQQPESPDYLSSRAGRNAGQILTTCLTMLANANALNAYGIGAYTGLPTTPALPSATVTDLAAMTIIPPQPVRIGGEKLLTAIEGFVSQWARNYWFHVQPDGTLRFLDQRTFSNTTFTMDSDPIQPARLARRYGDCYQRVVGRGQPVVKPILVDTLTGGLVEDFGYTNPAGGTVSSATAKAAYIGGQRIQQGTGQDTGTCTCPTTTTVTVTSSNTATLWASNALDQSSTGKHAWIYLWYSAGSGITQGFSSQVVSNTALTAGGTSTLTLAEALPITNYDHYTIYGRAGGLQNVFVKYKIANATIGAAVAKQFQGEVPFVLASGDSATLVSQTTGSVVWPGNPGNEVTEPVTIDPSGPDIYFYRSLYELCNNTVPYNVRCLLAVNTGQNKVASPVDVLGVPQFAGTSHTVEGLADTLTVSIPGWRDPLNMPNVQAYTDDLLTSIQDTVVEGSLAYLGFHEPWLTPGTSVSVTGATFTTGWEVGTLGGLPVQEATITAWDAASGLTMNVRASNRRTGLSLGAFLHPERTGQAIGGSFSPFSEFMPSVADYSGGMLGGGGKGESKGGGEGGGGEAESEPPEPPEMMSQKEQDEAQEQMQQNERTGPGSQAAQDQEQRDMQANERAQINEIMGNT